MILTLAELRRTPRKFLSIAAAVGFIVFLALILSALSDGLFLGSTGAYRSSSAQLFVYEDGSDFQLADSVLSTETFDEVSETAGGFPIVDAGMRQLAAEGWIHNRVRMLVASFLVKDLLIDWRIGERYFRRHLLDGDVAQNVGNWQWVAGTGTDAAPYFRVFNPVIQSMKFDPTGHISSGGSLSCLLWNHPVTPRFQASISSMSFCHWIDAVSVFDYCFRRSHIETVPLTRLLNRSLHPT